MIVILCDDFAQVGYAFDMFVIFLEENEPWSIKRCFEDAYQVETDDDLRYIFIVREYLPLYLRDGPDVIESNEFFDGIDEYYYFY